MEIINNTENNRTNPFSYLDFIMITLIGDKIQFYLLILTILIGIPGNVMSILIFIKPCFNNKTNVGFLYTLLCALNLIALLFNLLVKNPYQIFHYTIHLHLTFEYFIEAILLQLVSWSQVLITFDGFIAVVYPIKGVRIMSKRWVLYSIILGVFVVIIGLNSIYFIIESINWSDNNEERRSFYIEIIKVSMQLVIPYLIMVILDSIAINRLRKVKTNLLERQSTESNSSHQSSKLTRNTILINSIYLIFNLPSAIFEVYLIYSIIITNKRLPLITAYLALVFEVFSEVFVYIYPSFLFILFIVFNQIFRAQFISLVAKQKRFFTFLKSFFV